MQIAPGLLSGVDHVGQKGVPFLDGITVRHGPTRLFGRFFLVADAAVRKIGVTLRIHDTLNGLVAANEAFRETWAPLIPTLNPYANPMSPNNSFWISGHDDSGRLVATQAARFIDLASSELDKELRSMRLLYNDPAPAMAKGARVLVEGAAAKAAEAISGRITYSGGGWYHPDFRGQGLSAILPRISRCLALTRWNTQRTITLVEMALTTKGLPGRYGYRHVETGITFQNTFRGDVDVHLLWMDRLYLEEDIHNYMLQADLGKADNRVDAEPTNSSFPSRQGSISRS